VSGGTFFRNNDAAGDGDKNSPATVSTFKLDKYEVTVGRFRAFLDANRGTQVNPPETGSGENPYIGGSGWSAAWNVKLPTDRAVAVSALKSAGSPFPTWTDVPGVSEELPITNVTWYEAMAFCAWDGAFLPTDAELNYAAAGGAEQRAYPWSSPPAAVTPVDDQHANFGCRGATECVASDIHKVGLLPMGDGKFGQSDLAGNAAEWVLDWNEFGQGACLNGKNTTTDCADIGAHGPDSPKLMRGDNFLERDVTKLRTSQFTSEFANAGYGYFGIRCGRTP